MRQIAQTDALVVLSPHFSRNYQSLPPPDGATDGCMRLGAESDFSLSNSFTAKYLRTAIDRAFHWRHTDAGEKQLRRLRRRFEIGVDPPDSFLRNVLADDRLRTISRPNF
jgi:hypothetical protein